MARIRDGSVARPQRSSGSHPHFKFFRSNFFDLFFLPNDDTGDTLFGPPNVVSGLAEITFPALSEYAKEVRRRNFHLDQNTYKMIDREFEKRVKKMEEE
jgi:hypothetical protein